MTPKQYVSDALRTESINMPEIRSRIEDPQMIRLLHAAMGLETEVGEFMDPLKKYFFYGKKPDMVNLGEELGDLMWYIAIACDALGLDLETVMQTNINKLRDRFPEKFDSNQAINRNLQKESATLDRGFNAQPTTYPTTEKGMV